MRIPNRLTQQIQRLTREFAYVDTAYLLHAPDSPTYDDFGQITDDDVVTPIQGCSFTDKVSKEDWENFADVHEINAEARFTEPEPLKGDKIKVGFEDTDTTFEIVGIRNRDGFGYVVALKKVEL